MSEPRTLLRPDSHPKVPSPAVRAWRPRPAAFALAAMAVALPIGVPMARADFTYTIVAPTLAQNDNPALFGTSWVSTITFDNGNATNINQVYSYANIVRFGTSSVGGTFAIAADQPQSITFEGVSTNMFATTDALGNLILAQPFDSSVIVTDAAVIQQGTNVARLSKWWVTGTWQGEKKLDSLGNVIASSFGGVRAVPEPSSLALSAIGLAGLLGIGLRHRRAAATG
ncbi:MAG: PEP-CTERM sorting domain-containing protein [Isosphaeraceae bacterium]